MLPKSKKIVLAKHPAGTYLKEDNLLAFQYADCLADDARLVIVNALAAKAKGAKIFTYTKCVAAARGDQHWQLTLVDKYSGQAFIVKSRMLINATGPWVENFLEEKLLLKAKHKLALVKGSHIILPKFYEGDFAYTLQNEDNRIIFVIPYLLTFCLVGTTEIFYDKDPSEAQITPEEVDYLVAALNRYFRKQLDSNMIIHCYAGVRPLLKNKLEDPAAITRDYALEIDVHPQRAPIISIFGGKLTTYRRLAITTVKMLAPYFTLVAEERVPEPLPGGDYENDAQLFQQLTRQFPELPADLLVRYQHQYGSCTFDLLPPKATLTDLGQNFGAGLFQREVDYLIANEWATCAEDILWRRTKLGYFFPCQNILMLEKHIKQRR